MSQSMISIENLSKAYRLGLTEKTHDTLTGAVKSLALAPLREFQKLRRLNTFSQNGSDPDGSKQNAAEDDILWALKDVSFEVAEGEVVGIIGRNGAGKSTLLKVLSRITEPTSGRAVIRGRVSSLLEVGTGFHPELSGRDNIYLNGTILGMTKREIDRKFDEIVDFSGVERFLDTPVKRYSSGMQVRLAFAVAAHLEPEILVIDEVLAVGDAEFQKKCMGKMQDVAQGGRSVLFVSHNMAAVKHLCQTTVVLSEGAVALKGTPNEVIHAFLNERVDESHVPIERLTEREGSGDVRITGLTINGVDVGAEICLCSGDHVDFEIAYDAIQAPQKCFFHIAIYDVFGVSIINCSSRASGLSGRGYGSRGSVACRIQRLPLPPGRYRINVALTGDGQCMIYDRIQNITQLIVNVGDFYGTGDTSSVTWGKFLVDSVWL